MFKTLKVQKLGKSIKNTKALYFEYFNFFFNSKILEFENFKNSKTAKF